MRTRHKSLLAVTFFLLFSVLVSTLFGITANASPTNEENSSYVAKFYEGDSLVYEAYFKKPLLGGESKDKLERVPAVSNPSEFSDFVLEDGTVAKVGYSPSSNVIFRAVRKKDAKVTVNLEDDNGYFVFNPVSLVIKAGYTHAALYLPDKEEMETDEAIFNYWEDTKSKRTYNSGEIINVHDNMTLKARYTVNESYVKRATLKVKYLKREVGSDGKVSATPLLKHDGSAYDAMIDITDKNLNNLNIAFPEAEGLEVREVVYSESIELFGVTETSVGGIKGLKKGAILSGKEYETNVYYEKKSDAEIIYKETSISDGVQTGDTFPFEIGLIIALWLICAILLIAVKRISKKTSNRK